jgi:hypothetical protein
MVTELAARERTIQTALMAKPRRLRRGDDVVAAATIVHDLLPDALPRCMRAIGLPVEEFGNLDKSAMTRILVATPVVQVEMSLRRGWIENSDYSIEVNDLYDMAALGVAVVCCDLVATDRSARHRLLADAMDRSHHCEVVSKPPEILMHLERQT